MMTLCHSDNKKACFKCKRVMPLSEFYPHSQMGDGTLNKCRDCAMEDVRIYRYKNIEKIRDYDKERGKLAHRKELAVKGNIRRRKKDGYMKSHNAVARALKKGSLVREKCCMCGTDENIHAHHDDYSKPLDVMWLCPVHHKSRHAFLDYIINSDQEVA